MTDPPRMLVLPTDLGAKARRRGMLNPIPEPDNGQQPRTGWERIDLNDDTLAIKPAPPDLHPLIYSGLRHALSGPPEATKTLLAYKILLDIVAKDLLAAIIDFEMGANAARILLDELGATPELRSRIRYHQDVPGPPTPDVLEQLRFCSIVLIDSSVGAFDASGLDDNARKDVEKWAKAWIRPLFNAGIATLVLDHVTKNADTRGKFQIGSERKTGGVDIHLGAEPLNQLKRGGKAIVKIRTHKDRRGFLDRPYATIAELSSCPDTHQIDVALNPNEVHVDDQGQFRPTHLMQAVSLYLELAHEPRSRNQIEQNVKGKNDYIRQAIDRLIVENYAVEEIGARNAHNITSLRAYREAEEPQTPHRPHLAPTSPRRSDFDLASSPPPIRGEDEVNWSGDEDLARGEDEIERLEQIARSLGLN